LIISNLIFMYMKTLLNARRFGLTVLLAAAGITGATAQQNNTTTPDNEVRVKITERSGDEVREIERVFRNLPADERDKVVEKLVDSLKTTHKDGKKRQLSVTIEDNQGDRITRIEKRMNRNENENNLRLPKAQRQPRMDNRDWNDNDRNAWQYEFRIQADSMADRMNRVFRPGWDRQLLIEPFENWAQDVNRSNRPSSIRRLEAYPNNPDRDQLNIRFTAPAKGDVSIRVTTPGGKEIAKKDIKDFSGEFVGQIDLGKKASGIYFLNVTQNEDGAVKRVVVE
jgi:hypothetical protein